ncbi:MAG: CocE/NonD family hydrolase, partial [Thermomicrobiales bacterium]|nr:CocE/NonD family hydrolase [Thermomicrobiales bacterium]
MPDSLSIVVEKDIPVAMRDGTILRTDVYRPAEGGPFPVIMQRTPYNKETASLSLQQTDVFRAVRRGYAVVNQDVRGRYRSDGEFHPFHQEINDGYDAVEWAASQPWSTGKVGMFGTSYVGATQWLAAIGAPPSLKAIVPAFTASDYYEGWTYQGGAFQWGFMLNWVLPYLTTADLLRKSWREDVPDFEEIRSGMLDVVDNGHETARVLPLQDFPIDNELSPYFAEWLSHPERDEFWTSCS